MAQRRGAPRIEGFAVVDSIVTILVATVRNPLRKTNKNACSEDASNASS
jgi:hypothetical protein